MIRKSLVVALVAGLSLASAEARADERALDGVLGAGAGALVLGPVGLVAGGVIGYAAGPHINCGLRGGCARRTHHYHYRRQASAPARRSAGVATPSQRSTTTPGN
ncbi:hypothetical protein K9U39_15845 [Rhodoblastus acidophilus]|uniref:Uncharacterized protein n=1 Tax=Candidatus Rhodoblastus alkanivorans TaxID=2954117 RepID=A0ABS9Z1K6_9HYPH|nr:hypothetical protein [Candidatus Rhodoblastus alkanivorans]MCI4678567.1 hypothetical protein [Candidatus Rhodoblastus alkanivorans]MCI4681345.1 hypothetical protein [Candidatus Rhodoblastus alkanivorans]MDI4642393.1 hypothetical protein [Rhodoblastus acidophilus]